jgi:hypothetical protein
MPLKMANFTILKGTFANSEKLRVNMQKCSCYAAQISFAYLLYKVLMICSQKPSEYALKHVFHKTRDLPACFQTSDKF